MHVCSFCILIYTEILRRTCWVFGKGNANAIVHTSRMWQLQVRGLTLQIVHTQQVGKFWREKKGCAVVNARTIFCELTDSRQNIMAMQLFSTCVHEIACQLKKLYLYILYTCINFMVFNRIFHILFKVLVHTDIWVFTFNLK